MIGIKDYSNCETITKLKTSIIDFLSECIPNFIIEYEDFSSDIQAFVFINKKQGVVLKVRISLSKLNDNSLFLNDLILESIQRNIKLSDLKNISIGTFKNYNLYLDRYAYISGITLDEYVKKTNQSPVEFFVNSKVMFLKNLKKESCYRTFQVYPFSPNYVFKNMLHDKNEIEYGKLDFFKFALTKNLDLETNLDNLFKQELDKIRKLYKCSYVNEVQNLDLHSQNIIVSTFKGKKDEITKIKKISIIDNEYTFISHPIMMLISLIFQNATTTEDCHILFDSYFSDYVFASKDVVFSEEDFILVKKSTFNIGILFANMWIIWANLKIKFTKEHDPNNLKKINDYMSYIDFYLRQISNFKEIIFKLEASVSKNK